MTVTPHPPIHPTLRHAIFLLPSYERPDVSEERKKRLEVLNISIEEFQKRSQQWEKNVGTSLSNQKKSTSKKTRTVNSIKHNKPF